MVARPRSSGLPIARQARIAAKCYSARAPLENGARGPRWCPTPCSPPPAVTAAFPAWTGQLFVPTNPRALRGPPRLNQLADALQLHGRLNNPSAGVSDLPVAPSSRNQNHPPTLDIAGGRIPSRRRYSRPDHRSTSTCHSRGGRQTSTGYTARCPGSNLVDDHLQPVPRAHCSQWC